MRLQIQGRDYEITERFRQHVEPRIDSLQRHLDRISSVKVVVSAQRNWRTVEITVDVDGTLLRAEERADDELTSFDRALDAIEKQIDRYKSRHRQRVRSEAPPAQMLAEEEGPQPSHDIVRMKYVPLKPMTAEEAAMQMELLGHDFFMYLDAETESVAVVYRRKAGGYGVLMPEQ
ncbi:MAG: ribosome-associated translation inhibitor RaiA [Armatimonadetes bacterium]|nr:ribosome-associated translation inhibitor RaiA [Armatimonadota bacterium]